MRWQARNSIAGNMPTRPPASTFGYAFASSLHENGLSKIFVGVWNLFRRKRELEVFLFFNADDQSVKGFRDYGDAVNEVAWLSRWYSTLICPSTIGMKTL